MSRVVHVFWEFDINEGIARSIANIANELPGKHHLVTGRLLSDAEMFDSVSVVGGLLKDGVTDWRYIAPTVERLQPDIVHVHGGPLSVLGSIRATRGVPRVYSIYGWPRVPTRLHGQSIRSLWGSPPLNPRVVATTMVPDVVLRHKIGSCPVLTPDPRVVENLRHASSVFHYTGATPPRSVTLPSDTPSSVVVFAGRAELSRGPDTVIAAMGVVARSRPDLRAHIALLPGPDTETICDLARYAPNVDVTVGPVDLDELLAGALCCVAPFRFDYSTSPPVQVVTEALAAGTPVIGSDVSCVQAAVSPSCALVVPPGSPTALAAEIIRLANDRELHHRMSSAALAHIASTWANHSLTAACRAAYDTAEAD